MNRYTECGITRKGRRKTRKRTSKVEKKKRRQNQKDRKEECFFAEELSKRRRAPHGPVARVNHRPPVRRVGALPALRHLERGCQVGLGGAGQRNQIEHVRVARAADGDERAEVVAAAVVGGGHGLLEDVELGAIHGLDLGGVFLRGEVGVLLGFGFF